MLPDGGGAYDVIRVQIASLQQYADALQAQIDAVQQAHRELTGDPSWGGGSFGEALGLHGRHQDVAGQLRQLLAQVRGGIATAQQAAHDIAQKYRTTDELNKANLDVVSSELGSPTVSAGSVTG